MFTYTARLFKRYWHSLKRVQLCKCMYCFSYPFDFKKGLCDPKLNKSYIRTPQYVYEFKTCICHLHCEMFALLDSLWMKFVLNGFNILCLLTGYVWYRINVIKHIVVYIKSRDINYMLYTWYNQASRDINYMLYTWYNQVSRDINYMLYTWYNQASRDINYMLYTWYNQASRDINYMLYTWYNQASRDS